jgi:UDP-N-acetylglucosamine:LPS N-acetylglucosamine transferase
MVAPWRQHRRIGLAPRSRGRRRILAVSSGGGHWAQLCRLRPAFESYEVSYLTTDPGHRADVAPARFHVVSDANRQSKLLLARSALKIAWVVVRERPAVVVSTGAAPGYLAVWLAKRLGAHTVWIDSVANVEELSLSGRMASTTADLCLTQWAHLAGGPVKHMGAVL